MSDGRHRGPTIRVRVDGKPCGPLCSSDDRFIYVTSDQDLYDQRLRDMKARERAMPISVLHGIWYYQGEAQDRRNIERLAAYKRKRAEYNWP